MLGECNRGVTLANFSGGWLHSSPFAASCRDLWGAQGTLVVPNIEIIEMLNLFDNLRT